MGLEKVTAHIGLTQDSLQEVEFLVDTGSIYTFLPLGLAANLGITFPVTSQVILADSRTAEAPLGAAFLRLMDREGGILAASMSVPMPLLGASALEVLGLKVNPPASSGEAQVNETLEHSRPFGPAAL